MQVGDAPIIVFFLSSFLHLRQQGIGERGAQNTIPLPPPFASLIIAGVIEIRIKRVGVEVRGSGGVGGGGLGECMSGEKYKKQ